MKWEHQNLTVEDGDSFDDVVEAIVKYAHNLWGTDMMVVKHFGENRDLSLSITKDEDYNPAEDEEYSDLVDITTYKDGHPVDDSIGIYVTDGELTKELERIYGEKDMALL